MSMLKDIAQYITASGIATLQVDLFIATEPSTPDNCVILYEYTGRPPEMQAGYDLPGLQVRARSTTWDIGRSKLQAIQDLLQEVGNEYGDDIDLAQGVTINNTLYTRIEPQGGVIPAERDKNKRHNTVQNYIIAKERNNE